MKIDYVGLINAHDKDPVKTQVTSTTSKPTKMHSTFNEVSAVY